MEIKIRKIDPMVVKKIDEAAKEKDLSREAYLRVHLEKLAHFDAFVDERNRFEETMKNVMKVLNVVIDSLQRNEQEVKRLKSMFAMILNEDEEEFVSYLNDFKSGDSNG